MVMAKRLKIRQMSASEREKRTVRPRVSKDAQQSNLKRASGRVRAKTSIDFVRSVRKK